MKGSWGGCILAFVLIGQRLRELREAKHFSQGEVEKRTGLLRCYTSRVENGHTVPSVETLEKYARALEIPLYRLFSQGAEPPEAPQLPSTKALESAMSRKESGELRSFTRLLARMNNHDRHLLLGLAQRMAGRRAHTLAGSTAQI